MLKFLRKYDKWILAVGGSLLMVVFLLPQALQRIGGDPRKRVIATFAGGNSITVGERQQAAAEITLLARLHPTIPYLLLGLDSHDDGKEAEHWILLGEEARAAGFVGGPEDGARFLEIAALELAEIQLQQFGVDQSSYAQFLPYFQGQFMQQLLTSRDALLLSGTVFESDLARVETRARGILRLHRSYFDTPRLSDVESVALAKRIADQVGVNYVIMRPTRILPEMPMPTDEEVEAHFEQYKDVEPGTGEYGFGYIYDPAVKLEWLDIQREDVLNAVTIDPIEANAYWRQNTSRYGDDWTSARESVESDLRDAKADEILADLDRFINGEIAKFQRNLSDDGRFKVIPEDWALQRPTLEQIERSAAAQISKVHGVDLPPALVVRQTSQWDIREDISRFPNIALATMQFGPASPNLEELLFNVRELNPEAPYGMQTGVIYGPLRDVSENRYYFVVTDARPQQAGSLDDTAIQRRAIQNIRRLSAMETMLSREDEYKSFIALNGMEAFAEDKSVEVERNVNVLHHRVNPFQTADFDIPSIREAIMEKASTLDPTVRTIQLPSQARTMVLPSPRAQAVVVAEIIDIRPLTVESFQSHIDEAEQVANRDLFFEELSEWPYSWVQTSRRMGFVSIGDDEDDNDGDAEATTAAAGS